MHTNLIPGLSAVVDDYDLFLIDQWGVLHDGENLHDGALNTLQELRKTGKTVIILSNSGKRVEDSYARMERMGITRDLYDHVVTSGELVYRNFQANEDPVFKSLGRKFIAFTWGEANISVAEGSGHEKVDSVEEADFILCTGTDQGDLEYYRPFLEKALERKLPLICANPDFVSVAPDGSLNMCPGMVAKEYEDMGGTVRWHGKPLLETYEYCKSLAPGCDRILGIGDSLRHDVKGANDAGGHSLFVCGGIHDHEIGHPPSHVALANLFDIYGIEPTYSVEKFRW